MEIDAFAIRTPLSRLFHIPISSNPRADFSDFALSPSRTGKVISPCGFVLRREIGTHRPPGVRLYGVQYRLSSSHRPPCLWTGMPIVSERQTRFRKLL